MLYRRDNVDFQYYAYTPNLPAAVVFAALFGVTTLLHSYQMIRARTWFMVPFLIGGICEAVGYVGRILSYEQRPDYTLGPYVMQTLCLLVAPAFLAASIYMTLGRIVLMLDGHRALFIRRKWLTKIFVAGDVLSFFVQAGGGGLSASDKKSTQDLGNTLIIVGLFIQIVFFGLFVITAALFHVRIVRHPTRETYELHFWRRQMWTLYLVSTLIFIRSIVRVVEFIQGHDGYIISHEVFLYVFDGTLMFIAMVAMNIIHPAQVARELFRRRQAGIAEPMPLVEKSSPGSPGELQGV